MSFKCIRKKGYGPDIAFKKTERIKKSQFAGLKISKRRPVHLNTCKKLSHRLHLYRGPQYHNLLQLKVCIVLIYWERVLFHLYRE